MEYCCPVHKLTILHGMIDYAGTPPLGSTTRAISFPDLPQVNSGGHTLAVTVTPSDPMFPMPPAEVRGFRVGKQVYNVCMFIVERAGL